MVETAAKQRRRSLLSLRFLDSSQTKLHSGSPRSMLVPARRHMGANSSQLLHNSTEHRHTPWRPWHESHCLPRVVSAGSPYRPGSAFLLSSSTRDACAMNRCCRSRSSSRHSPGSSSLSVPAMYLHISSKCNVGSELALGTDSGGVLT